MEATATFWTFSSWALTIVIGCRSKNKALLFWGRYILSFLQFICSVKIRLSVALPTRNASK